MFVSQSQYPCHATGIDEFLVCRNFERIRTANPLEVVQALTAREQPPIDADNPSRLRG